MTAYSILKDKCKLFAWLSARKKLFFGGGRDNKPLIRKQCPFVSTVPSTVFSRIWCTFQIWGGGVAGSEDFACATLPSTLLIFKGKIKNFCHPTLQKIKFKITVTTTPLKKGKSQNYGASINCSGLAEAKVNHDTQFYRINGGGGVPPPTTNDF